MNDEPVPAQQQVPQAQQAADAPVVEAPQTTPAPQAPPAAPPQKKKLPSWTWIAGGVFLVAILVTAVLYIRTASQTEAPATPEPTPTTAPTPTPIRKSTKIASTSAFAEFHDAVASLSSNINDFVLQDTTLTPPVLDVALDLP